MRKSELKALIRECMLEEADSGKYMYDTLSDVVIDAASDGVTPKFLKAWDFDNDVKLTGVSVNGKKATFKFSTPDGPRSVVLTASYKKK